MSRALALLEVLVTPLSLSLPSMPASSRPVPAEADYSGALLNSYSRRVRPGKAGRPSTCSVCCTALVSAYARRCRLCLECEFNALGWKALRKSLLSQPKPQA